jgi:ubiquinone/menaquinone biosynthesis C-methylase UbiE
MKWPKTIAPLSDEQRIISDDFMSQWHKTLSKKFSYVDKFNHSYPIKNILNNYVTTLEVGAGNGEHLKYEMLTPEQLNNYVALDIRENMAKELKTSWPQINCITGDCQKSIPFQDNFFDRILAIHVLEHLPDLPAAIINLYRLCNKDHGFLSVVIPCEGGFAYSLAREISAKRLFEKTYKQSYQWFIEREHINKPYEIIEELSKFFDISSRKYFPIPINLEFCNLCIGITLTPKKFK